MNYQETYEFFAIDRTLTGAEMRALRAISTRAVITSARFYNFYDWGGLKGDPHVMLRQYFDLFIHTGSAGDRWGLVRFPTNRIDVRRWRAYIPEQRGEASATGCVSFKTYGDVTVLAFYPPDESGRLAGADASDVKGVMDDACDDNWEPGDDDISLDAANWAVPLALLRADVLADDGRGLYLAWLLTVQEGHRRDTTWEPSRPPGLGELTATYALLAEFLRLDADLLAVAAAPAPSAPRTVGQLLRAAHQRKTTRRRAEAARAARERARRLAALERRQPAEWRRIDRLVSEKKARAYREAITCLTALHELSCVRGTEQKFHERVTALLARHSTKHSFKRQVVDAGLLSDDVRTGSTRS